jgi:hypothetical protein
MTASGKNLMRLQIFSLSSFAAVLHLHLQYPANTKSINFETGRLPK